MVLAGPQLTSVEAKLCRKKNLKERRQHQISFLHLQKAQLCRKRKKGFIAFNLQKHAHSRLQLTLIYLSTLFFMLVFCYFCYKDTLQFLDEQLTLSSFWDHQLKLFQFLGSTVDAFQFLGSTADNFQIFGTFL